MFGRSFISPIRALQRATQAVASGQLDARVDIRTGDEFGELGDAFNTMANRLVALQEDIKRQERQATIGRIAAGLVHDLAHPIQNWATARACCSAVISTRNRGCRFAPRSSAELENLKRFMDDLRHVVMPRPVERFLLEVNGSLVEIVEAMRTEGARVASVEAHYSPILVIEGDRFALSRVYRNLMTNAIQATPPGGRASSLRTRRRQGRNRRHRHRFAVSPGTSRMRSSRSSSPPSAGLGLGWRSQSALSNSSTARSTSRARSDAVPPSPSGFRLATIGTPRGGQLMRTR